jgi:VanZ family protein
VFSPHRPPLRWIEREVMQAIAQVGNNATALQICENLKRRTGRDHPLAKIYDALNKMEARGLVGSEFTPQRCASLTPDGKALLKPDGTRAQGHAKYTLRTIWFIAILLVIVGSLLPGDSLPIRALNRLNINDKIEHFGAYAVLAFLPTIHERWRFVIAAALGAVVLGVLLEFAQLYSGWRDFEIGDMVADAVGVCFGLAVGLEIRIRSTKLLRGIVAK